ncbi:MAG: hypothetical protein ACE369_06030 [Roseovarius sp.]
MPDALDPKGLVRESYRIEGITPGECRSIFLDWALSVDDEGDTRTRIEGLIARYGSEQPDHPMTAVLREGLAAARAPKRRGGSRGRVR